MKKLLALLLALVMILSLAACGESEPTNDPATEPKQNEQTAPADGETLETSMWTLIYDADLWSYDEDELYDGDDYAYITMYIPDGEDAYISSVEIEIDTEDQAGFREDLYSYGFDEYEYAVNHSYDLYNVGGISCLKQETEYWGEDCVRYIGRDEAASVTVYIEILGQQDEKVDQLLAGLTINAEDVGNEDAPWYWDGEPFSASDSSAMTGTYTVNSTWLPIDACIVTHETFAHAVAVAGDKAYIAGDGVVKQYAYDGESLTYEKDLPLEGEYNGLQATDDGTVWISAFMEPLVSYKDGVQTGSYEDTDYVTMHPSGAWGISWFSGPDCEKLTFSGGMMSAASISFSEVSTISSVIIDADYIYVCGYAADDSGHKVFIYDENGALQMTLTDADNEGLGSITFMAQTGDGFIGMDGNMRDVILWTANGTYIGSIEDGDLFETYYPWFCGGALVDDGILVIMTEERADESGMELVAFKLSF